MFDLYMFLSFALMALIFLRQISVFKNPTKINYAPLMLGIGAIASVIHFIIAPESQNIVVTLKGSFIPFLVALMLYIIMNIMHQTQVAENERIRMEFTQALVEQISALKGFMQNLESRMMEYASQEERMRREFIERFDGDIETLAQLLHNQKHFMEAFKEVRSWHEEITQMLVNFTEFKLPELDSIIHRHIEMLQLSQQQEFQKLHETLKKHSPDIQKLEDAMQKALRQVASIEEMTKETAKRIASQSMEEFSILTQKLHKRFEELHSQSEALWTAVAESAQSIAAVRKQSEIVMEQMVLIAKKMEHFEQNRVLFETLSKQAEQLLMKVQSIEREYSAASQSLQSIAKRMQEEEHNYIEMLTAQTQEALQNMDKKVNNTLEELKEKYVVATDDISQSVKILAKKAQLQKSGYSSQDTQA